MGRVRSEFRSVRQSVLVRRHGQTQQLGTNSQPSFFCGLVADFKSDFIILKHEIDHPAGLDKSIRFTHGQDACVMQCTHDFCEVILLRGTDEENLAIGRLISRIEMAEGETAIVHFAVVDDLPERVAENILSQNPDDNGRIGLGKYFRRPLHELGEIKKKRRFEVVFGRLLLRECVGNQANKQGEQKNDAREILCYGRGTKARMTGFHE